MTDRERLIELIAAKAPESWQPGDLEDIASYLLANGVVVLPCAKGDVLKRYGKEYIANHWNIILTAFTEEEKPHLSLFDVEDAEKALVERRNHGNV